MNEELKNTVVEKAEETVNKLIEDIKIRISPDDRKRYSDTFMDCQYCWEEIVAQFAIDILKMCKSSSDV